MQTFTLDTNCIIALDDGRPEAAAVRRLVDAHAAGTAHVAVVAISASERQRDGSRLHSYTTFELRLAQLRLTQLEVLHPMAYLDVAYLDHCILSDEMMVDLERQLHAVLFPSLKFDWSDYAREHGLNPDDPSTDRKWLNAKCDVQALWSHIYHQRQVFVTNDGNFHLPAKKPKLIALGANRIERPDDASALV